MSWYNDVKNQAEPTAPGTYQATLAKVKHKENKRGDNMIVLGLQLRNDYVSKYLVIRQDLARIWIGEIAKLGVSATDVISQAEQDQLSYTQFFWLLLERVQQRVGVTIEIGLTYTSGQDLANVSLRRLLAEPRESMDTEYNVEEGDDNIPF